MRGAVVVLLGGLVGLMPRIALSQSLEELEQQLKKEQAAQQQRQSAEQQRKAAEAKRQASMGTLVVRADRDCALNVNGEPKGELTAQQTQSVRVAAGEQLIECAASDDGRIEQVVTVEAGTQKVLRLQVPLPRRFEPVADGVRDREQGVTWASRDNGSDVNWQQAQAYCTGLGAGWSLPSVAQLESLYDKTGAFARRVGSFTIKPATDQIGFTGGWYWSAEPNGSAEAWSVSLINGPRYSGRVSLSLSRRALCVRRS